MLKTFNVVWPLQAQQDALNKQHQLEKESAKAEVLGLYQRLEEVCAQSQSLLKMSGRLETRLRYASDFNFGTCAILVKFINLAR